MKSFLFRIPFTGQIIECRTDSFVKAHAMYWQRLQRLGIMSVQEIGFQSPVTQLIR